MQQSIIAGYITVLEARNLARHPNIDWVYLSWQDDNECSSSMAFNIGGSHPKEMNKFAMLRSVKCPI